MELPLQQVYDVLFDIRLASFNPCFNGTTSATHSCSVVVLSQISGFNPCFNGTTSATAIFAKTLYYQAVQDFFDGTFSA